MVFLVGAAVIIVAFIIWSVISVSDNEGMVLPTIVCIPLFLVWFVVMMVTPVSSGHVGVARWFGSVQTGVYPEGVRFMNPMYDITQMSIRRETIEFSAPSDKGKSGDAPSVVALSQDRNTLTVDVSFPYQINAAVAWKLFQKIGTNETIEASVLVPIARSAVRDVLAMYSWVDASIEKRDEVARKMQENVEIAVRTDLQAIGFTEEEAKAAFTFSPVQLRELQPDEKVRNSIAERVAADENLKRQRILTDIAKQEAERRANEGLGVTKLFNELPQGFKPSEIRDVLLALAEKERADALTKAVESGRVNVIVLPSSTPVAIPAQ